MNLKFLKKHWFSILGIFILCGLSFSAGWWVNEKTGDPNAKLIETAYQKISNESFFNSQTNQELAYEGIRGMLAAVDDPYAALIEPEAAQNFSNTFSGKTGVVGLYTTNKKSKVEISIVYPNGSAEKAGIRVGDILLAIDGKKLAADTNSSEAGLMMRGVIGSKVRLEIQRGEKTQEFELVRQEQQFVTGEMLPEGIGYVSLIAFNQTASKQMGTILKDLLAQNPIGLIWDLRNNEGGDMQAAQDILSYFINDGRLFTAVLTADRQVEFRAEGKAIANELPLVVLIDKTTYSAAETCAAAVNDLGRGKTIGSETYGKGVIQATLAISNDTMLQMTVAKWLSPNGVWYHGKGVLPQIGMTDDPNTEEDEILQKGIGILMSK